MDSGIAKKTRVYVIDTGRMMMDKNWLIAMHNPATTDNPHSETEMVEIPIYCVLIDHPAGKILFDASCHPESMGARGRWDISQQKMFPWIATEEEMLPNRLKQLNVDPDDIRYVVLSHLHFDHSGCLEMFKNATIVVHEEELSAAMRSYLTRTDFNSFVWEDVDAWVKNKLKWEIIPNNQDSTYLAEGIRILNLGSGHSYGMLALQINLLKSGSIIMASDAVYSCYNYVPDILLPGAVYDTLGYIRTVKKIHQLAMETKSVVWFGHCIDQFQSLRKSHEGNFYE